VLLNGRSGRGGKRGKKGEKIPPNGGGGSFVIFQRKGGVRFRDFGGGDDTQKVVGGGEGGWSVSDIERWEGGKGTRERKDLPQRATKRKGKKNEFARKRNA